MASETLKDGDGRAAGWGVLLLAHGAPDRLEDIPAFLLNVREGAHLVIWAILFVVVTLQMSTALRPIVGTSDRFLQTEKKKVFRLQFSTSGPDRIFWYNTMIPSWKTSSASW